MKKIVLSLAVVALSTAAFAQVATTVALAQTESPVVKSISIGSPIPSSGEQLKATDGSVVSLEKVKTENGLLVMFSCNTCPYVVKSQARTIEVMKMAKAMGIGMVIINSNQAQRGGADSYEAMVSYSKKQKYAVPYVVDESSRLADAFGATRTPEVYLFNSKGELVYKGAMEDNPSDPANSRNLYLTAAMKAMRSNERIDPTETKSIGCSIKRM